MVPYLAFQGNLLLNINQSSLWMPKVDIFCESKEQKGIRQVVEGVNSQIKLFNRVSRWRKGSTLLAYLYGYAISYSFFRKSQI